MTTETQPPPTDAEILGLNSRGVYFRASPTRYPEAGPGSQYHAGAPGVLAFARAVLAKWGTPPAVAGEPVAREYAEHQGDVALLEVRADSVLEDAARDVLAERQRQISAEGWTPEHDDQHTDGSMANAAACYSMAGTYRHYEPREKWRWDDSWWKPSPDKRRNLVKAGALILAEIERIDRAARKQGGA